MKDRNRIPDTKRELLIRLLDLGKVMIHLDARRSDVDVPLEFRQDADLRLNISYRFQHGDLVVDTSEVRATLSFSGVRHHCVVPIEAIFAIFSHVSGESFFFPTDAPAETLVGLAAMMAPLESKEAREEEPDEPSRRRRIRRGRPRLRAIDGGMRSEAEKESECAELFPLTEEEPESSGRPALQAIEDEEPPTGWTAQARTREGATDSSDENQEISDSGTKAEQGVDEAKLVSVPRRFGHLRVVK